MSESCHSPPRSRIGERMADTWFHNAAAITKKPGPDVFEVVVAAAAGPGTAVGAHPQTRARSASRRETVVLPDHGGAKYCPHDASASTR